MKRKPRTTGSRSSRAKSRRLEVRISAATRSTLQRAARLSGRTITEIVVDAAEREANRLVEEESAIKLNREESLRFLEALSNPPPVSPRLKKALDWHARLTSGK